MKNWPEYIKQHFSTAVPFFKLMETTVLETSLGQAKLRIPVKKEYANTYGIAHGGIVAALVDMAAGVALRTLKQRILTLETSATYFAPVALNQDLVAEAHLVRDGRKILHAEVNIYNSPGELVARGKAIYYVQEEYSEKSYPQTE